MKKGNVTTTRQYIVTVKELRKLYGLKGEVVDISLYQGRSPNEEEAGKDPDTDLYVITTKDTSNAEK